MLLQAPREVGTLAALILLALFAGLVVYVIFAARWLFQDAKRRGHGGGFWLTMFLLGSILFGIVPGVIVLVVYLFVRSPTIKYDDHGHLYVPTAPPPGQPVVPSPPTWQSASAPPLAPNPSAPLPPGQPLPTGIPAPQPPAAMKRVKCPHCLTIFPYQRAFEGPTHVKCPACGQEGNI